METDPGHIGLAPQLCGPPGFLGAVIPQGCFLVGECGVSASLAVLILSHCSAGPGWLSFLDTAAFCIVSQQYLSPQNPPVLSLSELSKAPVHNGLSTPLPPSEASSTRLSPPNVSALLDISLPGPPEDVLSQGEPATHISDSIIEIAISSGQYGEPQALLPASQTQFPWGTDLPPDCRL